MGHNKLKTHTKSNKTYQSIHAEFDAINNVQYGIDLKRAEMYIYRENTFGPAIAKPCMDCMELIKQSGIRKINYTIDNGYAQEDICI
jgi:deoxycytidylate deaminase